MPGTYQVFDLVRGPTTVKPHNYDTSFCVDFGTDTDGSLVTLQKCNGGASQKLYCEQEASHSMTSELKVRPTGTGVGDDHIAWEGGRTCLDAQAGSVSNIASDSGGELSVPALTFSAHRRILAVPSRTWRELKHGPVLATTPISAGAKRSCTLATVGGR